MNKIPYRITSFKTAVYLLMNIILIVAISSSTECINIKNRLIKNKCFKTSL